MEKIKDMIKKICTKEVMLYLVFGVLTTLVNLISFYVLSKVVGWEENLSNFIAIILAVLFAYFTNRKLVFHSEAKNIKERFKEFSKFIAGRAVTMVVEFVGCWILFKTPIPEMISKLVVTVIVVIMNFFISKFFAFKHSKKD